MARLRKVATAAAFCAACLATAYTLVMLITAVRVRRLTSAAQRAAVENPSVREAVPALVRRTPFENRWQVNRDYRADRLNLYIVRFTGTSSAASLAPFRDNCSAVARQSIVICDAALLETYLDRRGIFASLHPDRVASARKAFVSWTIGHEIGHVVAGDEPAHFKPSALNEQIARASGAHRQELAADAFVVRQLAGNPDRRLAIENLALDLLNVEIRRSVGAGNVPYAAGVLFDYRNEHVVRYLDRGTHPEHFVRAARLLEAAGELSGNGSLREMVKPLIVQLGEGGR
jgi:hypothetical protein